MAVKKEQRPDDALVIPRTAAQPSVSGVVEPVSEDIVLCSYPDTMDGFTAAWVVYQIARRDQIPLEFVRSDYTPKKYELKGRNWIAIGHEPLSADAKSIMTIAREKASLLAPIPYRNWVRTVPFGIETMSPLGQVVRVQDQNKSLARLTWEFFVGDRLGFDKPARLVSYVDDLTTGKLRFNDTQDVAAAISTYPHEFHIYDKLAAACEDRRRREAMIAAGQGIRRYISMMNEQREGK